jgi:hypothetical protein
VRRCARENLLPAEPEMDIPDEINRREDLVAKIDEARAKIEERERCVTHKSKPSMQNAWRCVKSKSATERNPKARPKLRVEPTAHVVAVARPAKGRVYVGLHGRITSNGCMRLLFHDLRAS